MDLPEAIRLHARSRADRAGPRPLAGVLPAWLAPLAVFLAAFMLFAPSFGAAFAVLDFNHLDAIRAHDASTYFARVFDPGDGGRTIIGTGDLYRPLYYTVFWLQYQAFGADPMPYYVFNAALHGVNAVLVFLLASRLTRSTLASLAGALVWAFHPQYADAVAWVSSTTDLLLVTFGVSAVLLYTSALDARGRARWLLYGASFAATLLALGAKETGMAVIVIIAGYHLFVGAPDLLRTRRVPWSLAPFVVLLIGYVVVRMALVGNLASEQDSRLLTWDFFRNVHRLAGLAAGPFAGQEVSNSGYGIAQGVAAWHSSPRSLSPPSAARAASGSSPVGASSPSRPCSCCRRSGSSDATSTCPWSALRSSPASRSPAPSSCCRRASPTPGRLRPPRCSPASRSGSASSTRVTRTGSPRRATTQRRFSRASRRRTPPCPRPRD